MHYHALHVSFSSFLCLTFYCDFVSFFFFFFFSLSLSRLVSLSWHLRSLFCLKTWSSWFFFFFVSPWIYSISWWEGTRWLLWELLWLGDSFETPGHSVWFPRQEMTILPCLALTHPAPHPTPQRWWGRDGEIFCPCALGRSGAGMGSVFLSPTYPTPSLPHTNKDYNCKFSKP